MEQREVTVIKARPKYDLSEGTIKVFKKKVAAYARVSTDSDEQLNSYKNQLDEYTRKISSNPEWEFVGIYADEGISGTSANKRVSFNKMIRDAKAGQIDLILTKSVSRMARNTELLLKTIRELKEHNVEIYFEKENLSSFDGKTELVLSLMSSIAQEESRSISENVNWTLRKNMKDGNVKMNTYVFLGYTRDKDGNLVVVEEEAKVIRQIYNWYTNGVGTNEIKRRLEAAHIKTGAGREKWHLTTIQSILRNEKYVGDYLCQKTYTIDYLTHKRAPNKGNKDQFYWKNHHEAIVDRATWDLAQKIAAERRAVRLGKNKNLSKYTTRYPFSGFIMCNKCGRFTKRRYWNYGMSCQKVVQICGNYLEGKNNCDAKGVEDDMLQRMTVQVINSLCKGNNNAIKIVKKAIDKVIKSGSDVDEILQAKLKEREKLEETLSELLDMKLAKTFDATTLDKKYKETTNKLSELINTIDELEQKYQNAQSNDNRLARINQFMEEHKDGITEINAQLIQSFFRVMIMVDDKHVVYVISTKEYSDEEIKKIREDIATKPAFADGNYNDEKYGKTINYKIALI